MKRANLVIIAITIFLTYGVWLGVSRSNSALRQANDNEWEIRDLERDVNNLDDDIDDVKDQVQDLDRKIRWR